MSTQPLFLVPLRLEARAVRRGAPHASIQTIGMGPTRAMRACSRVLAEEPARRPVAMLGVGGGLVSGMEPGDVVVASSLQRVDADTWITLPYATEVARLIESSGVDVQVAPLISSPKIVSGAAERAAAASDGALAVDMEAHWCAPLAKRHPFVVVRVLLDTPEHGLFSFHMPEAMRSASRALRLVARAVSSWSPTTLDNGSLLEVGES